MNTNRFYRSWVNSELTSFHVKIADSDLFILADINLEHQAKDLLIKYRKELREYIKLNKYFSESLKPVSLDIKAPEIVKKMMTASEKCGVGPMAAVAGAIAESVGEDLLEFSEQIIIENGGDIFIKSSKDRKFSVFAGNSPLSGKIGLLIKKEITPLGVCTSSGTVGHSLSFGRADAVTIISKDTALADSAATAICNNVTSKDDIKKALNLSKSIEGVVGCVIIIGDKIGSIGEIELV
ncbi:MAG: UPF0280 family protein [Candidatus Omnitrophica bacterium]|nr:UPF0280 family protein [Candidatus Omnitrophota bacterium]